MDVPPNSVIKVIGDIGSILRLFSLGRHEVCPSRRKIAAQLLMLGDELCEVIFPEHDGAFKDVQEFAHIAGVGVCLKSGFLLVGEVLAEMIEPPVVGDCADVLRAFAERRNAERHDVEPHEEVSPPCRQHA